MLHEEEPLWHQKWLLQTATSRRSCYTLARLFPTLIFANKIKTILLKQSAILFTSCRKCHLASKVAPTNRNISQFLLYTGKTFSNINFREQNKNNFVETVSYFVYQLSKMPLGIKSGSYKPQHLAVSVIHWQDFFQH